MIGDILKKSILLSALKGGLTTREESDTDINDYLEKVKRFDKIKRKDLDKNFESLYEIPDNWKWVQLGDISGVYGGKRIPAGRKLSEIDTGHKYIRVADMNDYTVELSNIKYVPEDIYCQIKNYTINKDDLYITVAGTIGKIGYIPIELDGANLTENANKIVFSNINKMWLFYVLKSPVVQKQIESMVTKVGQPKLAIKRIVNILIPLPPIEEQQRIVDRIDYIFDKLDSIEPLEKEIELLKKNFSMDIKKSIFLYAMQGKMSVQSQNESVNTNVCSSLKSDDIPFNIPDNWRWFGHNDMFEVIGGSQPPKSKFSTTKKEGYVQLYQTRDYGPNPQPVYVKKEDVSKFTEKGDIILARYGGSLGKVFWAEDGAYNVALARVFIKFPELINKEFLYYYYLSDLYQSKVKNGNRSAQAGFSKDDLSDLPFPLPPLEEQQRIVEKIEHLLPLCNDIENLVNS